MAVINSISSSLQTEVVIQTAINGNFSFLNVRHACRLIRTRIPDFDKSNKN